MNGLSVVRRWGGRDCGVLKRLLSRSVQVTAPSEADIEQQKDSEQRHGVKHVLHILMERSDKPLTAAELWEKAEGEGVKSKRFMKQMLQQMKKSGHVMTRPGHDGFVYSVCSKTSLKDDVREM